MPFIISQYWLLTFPGVVSFTHHRGCGPQNHFYGLSVWISLFNWSPREVNSFSSKRLPLWLIISTLLATPSVMLVQLHMDHFISSEMGSTLQGHSCCNQIQSLLKACHPHLSLASKHLSLGFKFFCNITF